MYIVSSYGLAVLMTIITMLCWGSWANTQKLLRNNKWPFQLFYWDYSIGVVLLTVILAITMGSVGHEGQSFWGNLGQAHLNSLLLAVVAGVVFNVANILLVAAIDIAGMYPAMPQELSIASF